MSHPLSSKLSKLKELLAKNPEMVPHLKYFFEELPEGLYDVKEEVADRRCSEHRHDILTNMMNEVIIVLNDTINDIAKELSIDISEDYDTREEDSNA